MKTIDYLQFSKAAKAAASECIALARRNDPQCHHVQRHVEILAIDEQGERIEPPLDYIDVKEISGKRLQMIVNTQAPAQWFSICVQGGLDCHENFTQAMANPENYEPMTDTWEVDSNDLEAAQVSSAERVKGSTSNLALRADNITRQTNSQGLFTRAKYKGYPLPG